MEANKKVMLAAALAVAIIALAGVGYAAVTDYKAATVSEDNAAQAAYVKAVQSDYSAFSGTVDLWTYTDSDQTIYSIKGSVDVTTISEVAYKGARIGDIDNITLSSEGISPAPTKYTVVATTTAIDNGWHYILKVGDSYADITAGSATIENVSGASVAVELYIAGPAFSTISGTTAVDGYATLGSSTTYTGTAQLYTELDVILVFTPSA